MQEPTLFHKIVTGDIPADVVYDTENVLGFKDIHPKAPTHVLFIAKKEKDFVPSIVNLTDDTAHVPTLLIRAAQQFAIKKGIEGYKLSFNCGAQGGQEVSYLHLHFLASQAIDS
ncbi:histidine triad nucleotide-binding protein [Candidatus Peregrinibacteria bacterium CG10_big_fil_rev_8_21_14_0_10_42_8]|nr:MAG: histidine triad nucleotide-binding protein [Candidatus Peregrinibacteria bacterium CG10_big_fil_rev_8_21_14_0_10_42_8]